MEENAVIFETLRQSLAAVKQFSREKRKSANIIVSDDGLQKMLNGDCTGRRIKALLAAKSTNANSLTPSEIQAAERVEFFREHGIAFVARPVEGRAGKFKKGSNLNYTLRLADRVKESGSADALFDEDGAFAHGYAEGDITIFDIILLLDKDSGLQPGVLSATVPEFVVDPKLVYTQNATKPTNSSDNYFTKAMAFFTINLFRNSLPNKALQGFLVPLIGHNVFLRKSFIEKSGFWAEDRVSEDFAKAIDAYRLGYHGKYIAYEGLDFTEYVSRTFTEETGKQLRYSYGIMEMLFNGTTDWARRGVLNHAFRRQLKMYPRTRFYDLFDMFTYFCSFMNSAALIPMTLIAAYTGYINHIWGGWLTNLVVFTVFPLFYMLNRANNRSEDERFSLFRSLALSLAFLGHTYATLKGFIKFLTDPFKCSPKPFGATNVESMDYSFIDGIKIVCRHYKENLLMLIASLMLVERGVHMWGSALTMTTFALSYICFLFPAALLLLTPPLFSGPRFLRRKKAVIAQSGITQRKRRASFVAALTRVMQFVVLVVGMIIAFTVVSYAFV